MFLSTRFNSYLNTVFGWIITRFRRNDVICVHIEVVEKARAHNHKDSAGGIHLPSYVFGFAKEHTDPTGYECYEWYAHIEQVDIIGGEHGCLAFGLFADKDSSINEMHELHHVPQQCKYRIFYFQMLDQFHFRPGHQYDRGMVLH